MNNTQNLVVSTEGLTKKYGSFTAVDELDLTITKGEIFGLLGPNGSGKTTIILMLLGLTEPTEGEVTVLGYDPVKQPFDVKRNVGYLPEKVGFYEHLTAEQNLKYFGRLNRIDKNQIQQRIQESLKLVDLSSREKDKVNTFSRGMKQRLGIANVLIKDPKLIILDEPTQGIDPKGIAEILDLFRTINKEKDITIMLSSHLIHHVQEVCDNIGIVSKGKMRVRGEIDSEEFTLDQEWIVEFTGENISVDIYNRLLELPDLDSIETDGDELIAHCKRDLRSDISRIIVENGGSLFSLNLKERNLIDAYRKFSEEY
jgi:ABC-2 type transport system ATP-binding protein